jgi:glycosyltransferase involved in cell wall biosynthesis
LDSNPASVSEAELAGWQAEGVIEYLGTTADVRPFLAAATVFVLPSYREGTPRSALEALATGRAVVVTDVPGCREVVIDGITGLLVSAREVAPLAKALERFILEPDLAVRMGEEGRRLAEERFEVTRVNQVMLEGMGL